MSDIKITDLVPQETIDKIKELSREIDGLLQTYTDTARELAKGLDINVKVIGDIDKLERLLVDKSREAAATTTQLNGALSEQRQIIADTTNTISRELMLRERQNKLHREEYDGIDRVNRLLDNYNQSYEEQIQTLRNTENRIKALKEVQKTYGKELEMGRMSLDEYNAKMNQSTADIRELQVMKSRLSQMMKAEEKANLSASDSYSHLSQKLEIMKKLYKEFGESEKGTDMGRQMEYEIQQLDAHLKDLAADMGEFQRNVGNYAIAGRNGVVSTESLVAVLNQEAKTMKDLADQTKILEEAKVMYCEVDDNFEEYSMTIEAVNAKLAENYEKLADVSDIMDKEATSIAEAEEQNKRLAEAVKRVNLTEADAQSKIDALNNKIAQNNAIIGKNTEKQKTLKTDLKEMVLSIATMTIEYNKMSDAEKQSAKGQELKQKINELTEKAGELKDAIADTNEAIKNAASDTRAFDQISAGVKLCIDSFGLATGAAKLFGLSEEDLIEVQTKLQAAMVASNAITQIQNALQKQSALMQGVTALQTKALAAAERVKAAAQGKGVIATKAATVAQKALNAVAKANPYYLLAAGIISVVGALALFTSGSKEAREAEEKRKKQEEEQKQREEEFKNAVVTSLSAQMAKYFQLKKAWEDLGDSMAKRKKFIQDHKEEFRQLGVEIRNVGDAQKYLEEETIKATKALALQAVKSAFKSELEEELKPLAKEWNEKRKYTTPPKVGERVRSKSSGSNGGYMSDDMFGITKSEFQQIVGDLRFEGTPASGAGGGSFSSWYMTEEAYTKLSQIRNDAAIKAQNEVLEQSQNLAESFQKAEDKINDKISKIYKELGLEQSDGGNNDPNTPTTTSNIANAKTADEIESEMLKLKKQSLDKQLRLEEEGSEQWVELKQQSIELEKQIDERSVKDNAKKQLEAMQESLKQKKISQEEFDKFVIDLQSQTAAELNAIEDGVVVAYCEANDKANDYAEKQAEKRIKAIEDAEAGAQLRRDQKYNEDYVALTNAYAEQLNAAGDNMEKRKKIEEQYNKDVEKLNEQYAIDNINAQIAMLEEILKVQNISDDDRLAIERELAQARIDLEKEVAEQAKRSAEEINTTDKELAEKRMKNAQMWMQKAAEALNAVNGLASAIYDGKIQQIEEEQEAQDEANDKELERITELVEKKVITEEEGEARKRALEAASAKKTEELEKKKAQLKQKQAIWDKANSLAQAGIATALAITQALPNVVLAAICGAMGAIQIATILATPIPKYAKGTDYHKGGYAIVGDGGHSEAIIYGDRMYMTPDTPTLVDIPKGASVIPSLNDTALYNLNMIQPSSPKSDTPVIVNNDYTRLEREMVNMSSLFKQNMKMQSRMAANREFELFKLTRI